MTEDKHITQRDLLKIRAELSEELAKMIPSQRKEYLKAATDVYHGLSKMARIREQIDL